MDVEWRRTKEADEPKGKGLPYGSLLGEAKGVDGEGVWVGGHDGEGEGDGGEEGEGGGGGDEGGRELFIV
ncbi:hypothetical protein NL676_022873 [Syzygium grande]|nr:hypothetical protein NL676_022873 [Syzygium grande]